MKTMALSVTMIALALSSTASAVEVFIGDQEMIGVNPFCGL